MSQTLEIRLYFLRSRIMVALTFVPFSVNLFLFLSNAVVSAEFPIVVEDELSAEVGYGRSFQLFSKFDNIASRRNVARTFRSSDLVPDILIHVPIQRLEVSYASSNLLIGNNLTIPDVTNQPEVNWNYWRIAPFFSWFFPNYQNRFTLIMLDPDALCRENPYYRSVLHWLVGNIEGNDLSSGDEVAPYLAPGPLPGTGAHRYVLLVFMQPDYELIVYPEYPSLSARLNFNLTEFIDTYSLSSSPEAGNYFLVENPEEATVPNPCDPTNLL